MLVKVKVVPGASRDQVVGQLGDALKVRVAAPPEDGKANKAVIRLLAGHFGVDRKRVRIVSGLTSHVKTTSNDLFRRPGPGGFLLRSRVA